MKELKKYSASFTLIGIFLLPAFLNILHFQWIDHENSHDSNFSDEVVISAQHSKDHNCEQFFFKVPASESLDLSYEFIQKFPEIRFDNSIGIYSFIYKNDKRNFRLLRGPPFEV